MKSRRRSPRSRLSRQHRAAVVGTVALVAGSLEAIAATQTLDISADWDTTTPVWDAGVVWVNGNDASIGGTASAVELAGDIQVSGIASANNVTFNNAIPGGTITLIAPATLSGGGDLTFNLAVGGTAGVTVDSAGGVITFNAENALSGPVTVTAGSLVLGANGALNGISALDIAAGATFTTSGVNQIGTVTLTNAGTLSLGGNDTIAAYVSDGGTFSGAGTLRASTYTLNDGSVIDGTLGNGVINANGTVTINGTTGTTGALNVQTGTTTVAGTVGATTLSVSDGATLATGPAGNLADTAALNLNTTGTLTLGHAETIGSLTGAGTVELGTNTLTLANGAGATSAAAISGTGGLALSSGTQTLSGASTYTGATNVNGGTLALTGSLDSTTVNVADGAALSSTGGLADGTNLNLNTTGTVTLTGDETLASLSAGTGAVNAAGVDLTVTGAFGTSGNVSVDDLTVGSLGGSGTIAATGTVTASSGSFSGVITSGSLVKDTAGSLTLSGVNTYTGGTDVTDGTLVLGHAFNTLADTGALTVQSGATVNLGANTDTVASFTSEGGTLAGTGTLTAATYTLNDGTVIDANLGAGAITANGTVALNGASSAATLTVQSGTTTLSGAAGATTVAVTGGTLDVDATGSLASAGTLAVTSGATFATQADQRIADTVAVTNAGTLAIGGDETVGSLVNTGTISGAGTLTTAVYQLGAGSNITGNLGVGTVQVSGNTGISGTSAAGTVNVNAGTLTLTGDNLADTAAVTNVATLTLTGDDTIGSLVNTGTIAGAGTLTAATYQLGAGSTITGNLGAGAVTVTGNTSISGTSAADTVGVNAGVTLTLSGDNLADTTALTLGNAAVLNLTGDETVGAFTNNAGLLSGFGTLTASAYTLNDGTVLDANLGNGDINTNGTVAINGLTGIGTFTVQTGQTTLANTSATHTVVVANDADLVLTADGELNVITTASIGAGGTLTTAGINQLGNATLTNAGTFTLGGNDTIGAYVSDGGTFNGPGTLTAATYALNNGSQITGNLGAGDLTANGTVQIDGTKGAGALTVESGVTTLNSTAASTDVTVSGGTLALTAAATLNNTATVDIADGATLTLGASNQLADAAVVTNAGTLALGANSDTVATFTSDGGALTGTGTLTAATYALNNGTVIDANLGNGDLTANGTVALNGTTGAGALLVESGTTTLANTSGATSVELTGGALTLTAAGSLQDTATIVLAGGTSLTTGAAQQLADTATVDSQGALNLGGDETVASLAGAGTVALGANTLTLANAADTNSAAVISGTGGLTLAAGAQTLSGASTYTGATNVNGGSLDLTGSLASTTVNVADGASLTSTGGLADATDLTLTGTAIATLTGDETLATLTGGTGAIDATGVDLTVTGTLDTDGVIIVDDLSAGVLNGTSAITSTGLVTASAGDFAGNIISGALLKNTAGTLTLSTTQGYTGTTTVTGGALALAHATDTIADGSDVTLGAGATLALGANSDTVATFTSDGGALTGTGTLTAATYALNNGTVIDANLGNGDLTANGTVALNGTTGAGALLVESGATTLANTSGATSVELTGGALTLTAAGSLQDTATIVLAGGTSLTTGAAQQLADTATVDSQGAINLGGDETVASLAGAGTVALGTNTLTLANAAGTDSAAVISGTGGVILSAGTQTLSGASTYTGDTTVDGGTLTLDGANASDHLQVNAGTLVLNATSAATTAEIAAGAALTTGAADRLANNVVIANDGTINLGGNETLGALSGTGDVNLGAFNLTFAGDGDAVSGEITSDFAGSISSTGTITKTGDDIQVLSGVSNYSGIAFVNDGILRVTNAGALGAAGNNGRTEVSGTGTLEISGGVTLAEVVRVTAVGYEATFTGDDAYLTSLGAINNLSGDNTLTGQIGIVGGVPDVVIGASGGNLTLTGDIIRITGALQPVPQLTFQVAEDASIALTGSNAIFQLANIVDIRKTGGGTLDITNIIGNSSTGDLLLHDGTVLIAAESRLGGSAVRFGDTDRGTLRIDDAAAQVAVVAGLGESITGGDGTFADFRATVFDFTSGDGTIFTEADTTVTLANLQNTTGQNIIKAGLADLLIDVRGGALLKELPTLVINGGNVFFHAEDTATFGVSGLGGDGGNLSFGALDVVIDQAESTVFGGNLDGTGNLTLNATGSAALQTTGVLSNFASVNIGGDGTGTVTLAGNNTYLGATNVTTGGNLILTGTSQTGALNLATGSTATLGAAGTLNNVATVGLATGSTLTLGGANQLADTAAVTNAGTLALGSNNDTIGGYTSNGGTLTGTGTLTAATYTLNDGTVIDANLGTGAVTTAGTVVLNGDTGDGTVTVTGGLLRLNGSTGAGTVTVQTGGELRGTATNIGGDLVIDAGGTLAPGASPGVTTVAGDLTVNGTFAAEIAGLGGPGAVDGHDQIVVGGTITLGPAGTLAIQRDGAFTEPALGDTFRIINGDLTGQQFATVTTEFATGLVLDLADGTLIGTGLAGTNAAGAVDLTTLPGIDANSRAMIAALQTDAFAADAANGVQINSASGAAVPAGLAVRALLTSPQGEANDFNKLSPETYAGDSAYAVHASRDYTDAARRTAPVARVGNVTLFTAYASHDAGTESSVNAADYDLSGSGGLVGARLFVGERSSLGVFAAFDSGEVESTHRQGDVTGQVFGAFAEVALADRWTLTASATLGTFETDSTRASLAGGNATANGVGSDATGFSLGLGYDLVKNASRGFSPYVEFNYMTAETDAFTEAGPVDALNVSAIEHTSMTGELGARGYVMVSERFSLLGHLAVVQDFGDDDTPVTARLAAGGPAFTVVSPGFGNTAFKAGIGADFAVTDSFTLSAGVEAAMSSDATTGTAFRLGGGLSF